jgi:hypothetical protein
MGTQGGTTRAVPGHKFGHDLSEEDKKALIVKCFTQSETNRLSELRMVSAAG